MFVSTGNAVIIKITDIIAGIIFGTIIYEFSIFLIEKTFAFYLPIFVISLNSGYISIRKQFDKIKIKEWLIISLIYIIGVTLIILIIKFKWFGYN